VKVYEWTDFLIWALCKCRLARDVLIYYLPQLRGTRANSQDVPHLLS